MNLKFSIHFQQAVIERNISIDHLKKTIKNPDECHISFGGRKVARKTLDGKILEVVYMQGATSNTKDEFQIITAYYILNK